LAICRTLALARAAIAAAVAEKPVGARCETDDALRERRRRRHKLCATTQAACGFEDDLFAITDFRVSRIRNLVGTRDRIKHPAAEVIGRSMDVRHP